MRTQIQNQPKISYVIPCYHSEQTLAGVVDEIDETMRKLADDEYEIVMVNDGSGRETWEEIRRLCQERAGRKGYDLARNFGQHAALMTGIRHAAGDVIICLDDDGQTPADEAGKLLAALRDGADVAYASYEHKEHSIFRNFGSWVNEKMLEKLLNKPKELYVSSYFAMKRFVADEVLRYENSYPYLLGLVLRSTDHIVNVPVQHRRREVGRSGYTLGKLLSLWMNGFTAFSIKPLRIGTAVGAVCAAGAFAYGIFTIVKKLVNPAVPVGFSALMTAVVFFGGMILLMLGLVGEYVGRTYICANNAPQAVIREEA
jgi:glycosyltransferase involved in cell wall biosynthesis